MISAFMPRFKPYDYRQSLMVPLTLEGQLAPGTLEHALHHLIEERVSEECKTYSRRLAIVEPVFANLRSCKRLDRFTYRGQAKVNIQWLLYCLVHNLGMCRTEGVFSATKRFVGM